MGVLTNVYSVPAKVMKKIDEDNERLGFLFGDEFWHSVLGVSGEWH